jgi:hypothetical protein
MTLPIEPLNIAADVESEMLSRGAARLLDLIRRFNTKYGKFYASQIWIGDQFKRTTRTIRRWTAELRRLGWIKIKRRSQNTILYKLLQKMSGQVSGQVSDQMSGHFKEDSSHIEHREHSARAMENTNRKPPRKAYDPHEAFWRKCGLYD